jgi:hypothetical protein
MVRRSSYDFARCPWSLAGAPLLVCIVGGVQIGGMGWPFLTIRLLRLRSLYAASPRHRGSFIEECHNLWSGDVAGCQTFDLKARIRKQIVDLAIQVAPA